MTRNIRDSAKGELCQIRLPGVCNHDPATVVWCHLWGGGTGSKALEIHGAYGCSECHDETDRRTKHLHIDIVQLYFYEAMVRSQLILIDKKLIHVAD